MPEADRTEFVPDPVSLERRVERVTDALNALRGKIQGRGAMPIGSQALAAQINSAQEHWREVAATLTAAQMTAHPYDSSATIEAWERKNNEIVDSAIAEGVAGIDQSFKLSVTHTAQNAGEALQQAETAIEGGAKLAAEALLFIAGLAGLYFWASSRKK